MATARGPKIVVIGGGTGTFTVLSGLKHYASDLTAIVNMVDDGGSSGILRDEFGALPPGDVRQALVALASSDKLRELFNYRFPGGTFEGHAFGNLFLSTVEKLSGNFASAIELASQVLAIKGRVIPITTDDVRLGLETVDGRILSGETIIGDGASDDHLFKKGQAHRLFLEPDAKLHDTARRAIASADIVIIGPGKLYSSLLPSFLVDGLPDALRSTKAKIVYICNLMTQPNQTAAFKVQDFASEVERYAGGPVLDYVLYNTSHPSKRLLSRYAEEGEEEVLFDADATVSNYQAIGEPLIATTPPKAVAGDTMLKRTFIRHDPDQLAKLIMRLYFS